MSRLPSVQIASRPISPPWDSGSMNMAHALGLELARTGHKVSLPVVDGYSVDADNLVTVPVYSRREASLLQKAYLTRYLLFSKQDADVIHMFIAPTKSSNALLQLVAKARKLPIIMTITHIPKAAAAVRPYADHVVTYSRHTADVMLGLGVDKVTVIPPGIDLQQLESVPINYQLLDRLDIPASAQVVLYAGELGVTGITHTLMNTIQEMTKKRADVYFILACRTRNSTDMEQWHHFSHLAATASWGDKVRLLGTVPDIHTLISRANVCMLPIATTYGKVDLPLFLIESAAMGKPVICSNMPPMNELLQDPVGLSVPPNDVSALVQSILELINKAPEYGNRAQAAAKQRYTIGTIASAYQSLYLDVLNERH